MSDYKSMTVDYQLQKPDLIAFSEEQRDFVPSSPSRAYYVYVLPLLCAGLAIMSGSFAIAAVFSILYGTSAWLVGQWAKRLYQRAIFCDENLSVQTLPQRATLSSDGLSISSAAGVLVYRWPFITRVVRSSRYVCFVLTPLDRVPIPLRAFRDEDHVQQFVRTAEAYAKAAQQGASPNGDPATATDGSGTMDGPPSVS